MKSKLITGKVDMFAIQQTSKQHELDLTKV